MLPERKAKKAPNSRCVWQNKGCSPTNTYDVYNRLIHRSHDSDADGTSDLDDYFAGFDADNPTLRFQVDDAADAEPLKGYPLLERGKV